MESAPLASHLDDEPVKPQSTLLERFLKTTGK